MNAFRSQLPKSCLSREDEEYLQRNDKWADSLSFAGMYTVLVICFFVVGFYIYYLKDESKNPNFSLYIEIFHNYGWLVIIPIYLFIHNLAGIIMKHKVNNLKKRRSKCPKI